MNYKYEWNLYLSIQNEVVKRMLYNICNCDLHI